MQTLPPVSLLNSGWPHRVKRLASPELNPPVNSDSDPETMPKEDPEETSAQDPEVLSWGHPGLDTTPAPSWPVLRSLLQQLPPQDSDERYCLALGEEELAELRLFCAQRRREALGQGVARLVPLKLEECTCENCRERLRPGEYGVFAARAGERRCWHRACFACQACGQALINLIYFYHDGRLYCGRHHAELLRPRCPACDQSRDSKTDDHLSTLVLCLLQRGTRSVSAQEAVWKPGLGVQATRVALLQDVPPASWGILANPISPPRV
ncbi:hypothetical protein E5288_WYG011288 [Bos mutus]|uniref:Prickle-like protein 4 n=1 Tax=Bos mutus TaxID=72004 RepID=A0A6B0R6N9_9CETA|nr:hypothetical protein [Bos mutus]